ncbi:integrase [Massilia sp. UYP32]|uniref:tyrosine-type recombinase/integrase n=1 Tax=Massilia sp. UYP32 TaxID=1756386 RepID=UPI003D21EDA0
MKTELTMALIKRLRLDSKPVGVDAKGDLVFEPNLSGKDYIVYDASQEAPPGFGIRVAKKKTFIIRRKVHGKSFMPTVGNVADFMADTKSALSNARAKAAKMALEIVETRANPNETARKRSAAELTLGEAFEKYRHHLATRTQRPATKETLRVADRAARKFDGWKWMAKRIKDLTPEEIQQRFEQSMSVHPTANEQAFRWATAAVRWSMGMEELDAASAGREPLLRANPFMVLTLNKMFRSREQVERDREEKGKRNPLTPSKTIGQFLEVAWAKRAVNDNETGVHYLMLMLLWGCRKSEHAPCRWGELLSRDERRVASHVVLDGDDDYGAHVFFARTKNGRNHRLPLGPMATELLRRRQASAAEECARRGFDAKSRGFVFPARSKQSKSGHYSDATTLLDAIRDEAGIEKLTRHDLRRSFGAMMTTLDVPEGVRKRFFNHSDASVTDTYTRAEWALLREWMTRIEQEILAKAPNVYNALKPVDWPMLAAPEPRVSRPARARPGRPRRGSLGVIETGLE